MRQSLRTISTHWRLVLFCILLGCIALAVFIPMGTGWTLRERPRLGLSLACLVMLVIGLRWDTRENKEKRRIWTRVIHTLLVCFGLCVLFYAVLRYDIYQERCVTKDGTRMVAAFTIDDFIRVDYYQYKNPFFYGTYRGYEEFPGRVAYAGDDETRQPLRWTLYDETGKIIDQGSEAGEL